jgi:hypothetical protein
MVLNKVTLVNSLVSCYNDGMKSLNKLPGSTERDRWAKIFTILAVVIFGISGWAWWHVVRSDPERTFYSALDNSLRTTGVSRRVAQDSGQQKLNQEVFLSQGAQHVARSTTTSTTAIEQAGNESTTVKTEAIGTPTADYDRYLSIDTTQKSADGKQLDFTSLLNIWGKSETAPGLTSGQLYNESALGVVPIGNIGADKRGELLKLIRDNNVYELNEEHVERKIEQGRPVYTYEVTVSPEPYINMLKQFAAAMKLTHLQNIDASQYKDSSPITFKIKVDVWGQQITQVEYQGGSRTEKYGSYGVQRGFSVPTDTIPVEELQAKLQSIQ